MYSLGLCRVCADPPAPLVSCSFAELADDPIVFAHLDVLKANLLEQNLTRLIEPFSKVQIAHVAKLIDLPRDFIEAK
jgi:26S proteasome regulatory subunit N6